MPAEMKAFWQAIKQQSVETHDIFMDCVAEIDFDDPEAEIVEAIESIRVWTLCEYDLIDALGVDDQEPYELAFIRRMVALEDERCREVGELMGESQGGHAETRCESEDEDEDDEDDFAVTSGSETEKAGGASGGEDDDGEDAGIMASVEGTRGESDEEEKDEGKTDVPRDRYQQMIDDFDELEMLAKKKVARSERLSAAAGKGSGKKVGNAAVVGTEKSERDLAWEAGSWVEVAARLVECDKNENTKLKGKGKAEESS